MQFELIDKRIIDIYENYSYEFMDKFNNMGEKKPRKNTYLKLIYDAQSLNRFKLQKNELKEKCKQDIEYLIELVLSIVV